MGVDIWSAAEVRQDTGEWKPVLDPIFPDGPDEPTDEPFSWRNYTIWGFLAGVRGTMIPIVPPRGLPDDLSEEVRAHFHFPDSAFGHHQGWLSLAELLAFDYDRPVEGQEPLRNLLGERYFETLRVLESCGPPDRVRIVFLFGG
jgi:hypothetical protein